MSSPTSEPTSDPDLYGSSESSTTNPAQPYRVSSVLPHSIPADRLPTSISILGPLTGYTIARRNRVINERLLSLSKEVRRPLKPEEQEAIAFSTSAGVRIGSYGPTIGVILGLTRWWRTRHEMRWLWLGKLKDDAIPTAPKEPPPPPPPPYPQHNAPQPPGFGPPPPLSGASEAPNGSYSRPHEGTEPPRPPPNSSSSSSTNSSSTTERARAIRWDGSRLWAGDREILRGVDPLRREAIIQGFRALPYIGLGWIICSIFSGTIGGSVVVATEMNDGRLQNLMIEVKRKIQITRGAIPPQGQGSGQRQAPPDSWRGRRDPMGQGPRSGGELWRGHRESIQRLPSDSGADDGSPHSYSDTSDPFYADESSSTPLSDDPSAQQDSQSQGQQRRSHNIYERRRWQQQQQRSASASGSPSDDNMSPAESTFDEDSPTGGMGATDDFSPYPSTSRNGGNAGRRSAGGEGAWARLRQQQQQQQQSGSSSSGSSDTYPNQDRDQDRAQREFDARIERERRGGDFDSDASAGGGTGRGGRRNGVRKW